jgi:hypothetical protein
MSEDRTLDRIYAELDRNTDNIEKLSKVVYTQSSTLALVTKIVIIIITFLIVTSLAIIYDRGKSNNSEIKNKKSEINNTLKKSYLVEINKKGLSRHVWEKLNKESIV